jgi:leucyl aminopeptidase
MKWTLFCILFTTTVANAQLLKQAQGNLKPILADLNDLRALRIPVSAENEYVEVGFAKVDPFQLSLIHERAHKVGKCGGFEDLEAGMEFFGEDFESLLSSLEKIKRKNELYHLAPFKAPTVLKDESLLQVIEEVSESNLRAYVQWLSSFPNRDNKSSNPNRHVTEMITRLEAMLSSASIPFEVSEIAHSSTAQKSIRVRLIGRERPNEIIVLGGHLDSINQSWGGGGDQAPGADDNASGSANLIEALRILMTKEQPKRTIEFFWYAGEESGLLGSAEIAKQYKNQNKDVIAVLQLDMTLFPGSGEGVIGSMTDFTSAWLRDYLKALNATYLKATIIDDKCGYGCSDHASWNRQGYPAIMPFESSFKGSNKNIHTAKDVISPALNFKHSALYSKIAILLAMDLGNSSERQPY